MNSNIGEKIHIYNQVQKIIVKNFIIFKNIFIELFIMFKLENLLIMYNIIKLKNNEVIN